MKSDPSNDKSTAAKARSRRVILFARALEELAAKKQKPQKSLRILDIGGTIDFWRMNAKFLPKNLIESIEVVNLPPFEDRTESIEGIRIIAYCGNALDKTTLKSQHYDVVHSNSVIEHVGNLSAQKTFAEHVQGLSDHYFIQTPTKTFPLEPHFYFPFFALLPLTVRAFLFRHLNLGFMGKEPDWLQSRIKCEETRLLSRKECTSLFPDGNCLAERMFFMAKSWMLTNMATEAMQEAALRVAAGRGR